MCICWAVSKYTYHLCKDTSLSGQVRQGSNTKELVYKNVFVWTNSKGLISTCHQTVNPHSSHPSQHHLLHWWRTHFVHHSRERKKYLILHVQLFTYVEFHNWVCKLNNIHTIYLFINLRNILLCTLYTEARLYFIQHLVYFIIFIILVFYLSFVILHDDLFWYLLQLLLTQYCCVNLIFSKGGSIKVHLK